LSEYPEDDDDLMAFDEVVRYEEDGDCIGDACDDTSSNSCSDDVSSERCPSKRRIAIVTYGNGVVGALRAAKTLKEEHGVRATVIDSPYVGKVPSQLREALKDFRHVLFADVCKTTSMPLATTACELQNEGGLENVSWRVIGAQPTYNPLGTYLTFLSSEDIVSGSLGVVRECDTRRSPSHDDGGLSAAAGV